MPAIKVCKIYSSNYIRKLFCPITAIAYVGLLLDFEFVHDAMQDELITKFMQAYMDREATSTLKPLPGIDLKDYKAQTVQRFQNSYVRDTLARLAVDGSDRILKFVLPVIYDRLASNQNIWLSTAIVATFAFYANGVSVTGKSITIVDRNKDKLIAMAEGFQVGNSGIDNQRTLFGDLVDNSVFVKTFNEIYKNLRDSGARKTIKWLIEQD